jgi:S-formylglutathione hydrolase FrmB
VAVVAVALALASVAGPGVSARRLLVATTLAVVAGGLVVLGLWAAGSRFPAATVWWGAAALGVLAYTVSGWRAAGRVRRILSVLGVTLLTLSALGSLNASYGTYPTLHRLLTLHAVQHTAPGELGTIERRAAASGHLPGKGVVVVEHIPATASGFRAKDAYVYLPPAWFRSPRPALPTLILLPGEPGSPADWTVAGDADVTADAYAAAHSGRAPIIVMVDPNGFETADTECVNSSFGNAETYLTVDVPAFARTALGASSGPHALAIAGLSAGGTCSIMLALRHPAEFDTFATFSGFAAPTYLNDGIPETVKILFGGSRQRFDEHDPLLLLRGQRFPGLAGWFEVGDQDTVPHRAQALLVPAAKAAGIDTCARVVSGGHDSAVWRQAFADALPWLAWRLGLGSNKPNVPATCATGAS